MIIRGIRRRNPDITVSTKSFTTTELYSSSTQNPFSPLYLIKRNVFQPDQLKFDIFIGVL